MGQQGISFHHQRTEQKHIVPLRIGEIVLCKAGGIRMSMWMESICAATGGEFENVAILVAIAVNEDGYRRF